MPSPGIRGETWLLALIVLAGCHRLVGGPPTEVRLSASNDSMVLVAWSAPAEASPQRYVVSFMPLGQSEFGFVGETSDTLLEHLPSGVTGQYRVVAQFDGSECEAAARPSTVPVLTDTVALAELDASGNSGFGWDTVSCRGRTWAMGRSSSNNRVDFYLTDFAPGCLRPDLAFASPSMGPSDPSGRVPVAPWHSTRFAPLPDEQTPLPTYDVSLYLNYCQIDSPPFLVGCRTEGGHYALVKVTGMNRTAGEVQLVAWYQPVRGLRLIGH